MAHGMAWENINYYRLTRGYLNRQKLRFMRVLAILRRRAETVAMGRTVPDPSVLAVGRGRRLEAAVLFLDICGFSKRPAHDRAEQETMLRVLTIFFSEMIGVVEDYDGTVEKNTGDGLMAYFVRSAGVDGAVKAVAAAMTLMDAAQRRLDPLFRDEGLEPLKFRIAIDRGWVTIANVGSKSGFKGILAIGTTANVASKMLAEAGPMSILIGANAAAALPMEWSQHLEMATNSWGWSDTETGQPYALWEFTGRWLEPASGLFRR